MFNMKPVSVKGLFFPLFVTYFEFTSSLKAISVLSLPNSYKEAFTSLLISFKSCGLQLFASKPFVLQENDWDLLPESMQLVVNNTKSDANTFNVYSVSAIRPNDSFQFHPENRDPHAMHKFIVCHAHVFLGTPNASRVFEASWLANPQYILFVNQLIPENLWSKIDSALLSTVKLSYYTVAFIYIIANLTYVKILCIK